MPLAKLLIRSTTFAALALVIMLLTGCSSDDSGLSVILTCGNGVVESGEQCDSGGVCNDMSGTRCRVGEAGGCAGGAICVAAETENCSSLCQLPVCGDGFAQGGLEQCDTFDLRGTNCATFGRAPNPDFGPAGGLLCTDECRLDSTNCGASFTPTATFTETPLPSATPTVTNTFATQPPTVPPTSTPLPTPTEGPACNLPILEPGEFAEDPSLRPCPEGGFDCECLPDCGICEESNPTCDIVGTVGGTDCQVDAQVLGCSPTENEFSVDAVLYGAIATEPTAATLLVGYQSDLLSLPDRDGRVDPATADAIGPGSPALTPRDFDYAVRLVYFGTTNLGDAGEPVVRLHFQLCADAPLPDLSAVACSVEGCSGQGGGIPGCTCEIVESSDGE